MPYKDRETRLQYHKDYQRKHREHLIALSKANYARLSEEQLEERRIRNRQFYALHRKEILAKRATKNKALTKEQLEAIKLYHKKYSYEWTRLNRDKRLASFNKRRALEKKATVGEIDYDKIYIRDNHRCQICGKKVKKPARSFDHIIPLSLNGEHSQINLQLTHLSCNVKRGAGRLPSQIRMLP